MQYHSPEGQKEPGETYPDEVHFFDQDMKEMDERKQESVCVTRVVRSDSCFSLLNYSPCNARRSDPAGSPPAGNTPAPFS